MCLLILLLLATLNQRELFGAPVFEQVRDMRCEFASAGLNTGEGLQTPPHLRTTQQIAFRSIDRTQGVASMTIATESIDVTVKGSAVAVSFLKTDPNDLMMVTVFRNGQRPASPAGWMYDAVLSRHALVNERGVVSQSKGTCKTLSSFEH